MIIQGTQSVMRTSVHCYAFCRLPKNCSTTDYQDATYEFHSLMAADSLTDHCKGQFPHSQTSRYMSLTLPSGLDTSTLGAFPHLIQG